MQAHEKYDFGFFDFARLNDPETFETQAFVPQACEDYIADDMDNGDHALWCIFDSYNGTEHLSL